jgi:hypothetical protein
LTEQLGKAYDNSGGVKLDDGKVRYELIPPEPMEALGRIYTDGAVKYGDRNWEKGMSMLRLFGAMMRHAFKWAMGETYDIDPKTGAVCHHMIQVAWNAFAIYTLSVRGQHEFDDRTIGERAKAPPTPEQVQQFLEGRKT